MTVPVVEGLDPDAIETRCAWCDVLMRAATVPVQATGHGICEDCRARVRPRAQDSREKGAHPASSASGDARMNPPLAPGLVGAAEPPKKPVLA